MSNPTSFRSPASWLLATAIVSAVLVTIRLTHELPPTYAAETRQTAPEPLPSNPQAAPPKPQPSVRDLIGVTALEKQLGDMTPTGLGIVAGHVEGAPGDYLPRTNGDAFRGVTFLPLSGASKPNGHAQGTAKVIYGPKGLAPGIRRVQCLTINDFLTAGYLRVGMDKSPAVSEVRVFSHSWVARNVDPGDALRRADYVIDTNDVVMVVGVDNGRKTSVPGILASAYNVIAVGSWYGDSSGGYTEVEGEGRCKPDIVAPGNLTSFSTPVVAAIVARLQEAAARLPESKRAAHSEVLKAVLLAGATKPSNWKPAAGKPLDEHLGAGRANLLKSHTILTAGTPENDRIRKRMGWQFTALPLGQIQRYRFDTTEPLRAASVALVWNRRIRGSEVIDLQQRKVHWLTQPRLADFDLRLLHLNDEGEEELLAESASAIDNVEHIYLPGLKAGRYILEVSRKDQESEEWDYALAWRMERKQAPTSATASAP